MEEANKLYQISEIRRLENLAIQHYGISEFELMQQAGYAAFLDLIKQWPVARKILVICGKGNNGGDGYILAHHAYDRELEIVIRYVDDLPKANTSAWQAYELCHKQNINIQQFQNNESWDADVIVDAIFGIGVERELTGVYRDAVVKINSSKINVLSMDVPSGLNADTGNINGVAVKATITSTFIALKCGLFTGHGPENCGKIFCHDLSLPKAAFHNVNAIAYVLSNSRIKETLAQRPRDANKGLFGHVLVIGGFYGMAGAARLAAEAALRVGAGLVSVATLPEHVGIVTTARPEIMCHGIKSAEDLQSLLAKASVIVIGPGLGKSSWSRAMLAAIIQTDKPKILDADALNLLAENPQQQEDWILTPHPGEASRLLSCSVADIQQDRFTAVKNLQTRFSGVCVLKGAGTLIKSQSKAIAVCSAGNPGMASAGMGDVLSGILGGLVAQKLSLKDAAEVGVLIHARAGDQVAMKCGERGMIASDLLNEIRLLIN